MHKEIAFREDRASSKNSKMLLLVKLLHDIHFNNPVNNLPNHLVFQHIVPINIPRHKRRPAPNRLSNRNHHHYG
jgi:hypothetical protein